MAKSQAKQVLFLCTGNYFRSRYAEIYFNSVAKQMGLPWIASSRALGLAEHGSRNSGPIARATVKALEEKGIRDATATTRMPIQVTIEDLQNAERVVALKHDEHRPMLQDKHPEHVGKVEFWYVDDNMLALQLIDKEVLAFVTRLLTGGTRPEGPFVEPPPEVKPPVHEAPKKMPTLKVGRETAGRRGKGVTTIFDTPLNETQLEELATKLKQRCGTGGTVKDGVIEIQGDQRERIVAELEKLGYKVKRVGG
jgi:translation initiation factor 1